MNGRRWATRISFGFVIDLSSFIISRPSRDDVVVDSLGGFEDLHLEAIAELLHEGRQELFAAPGLGPIEKGILALGSHAQHPRESFVSHDDRRTLERGDVEGVAWLV